MRRFVFFLTVFVWFSAVACGEDDQAQESFETEEKQQGVGTECEPQEGFDTCYEVDITEAEYWQETVPSPDWREVTEIEEGVYEVEIDARELNGQLMPTYEGEDTKQGHYESEEQLDQVYSELIGVDVSSDGYVLKVQGTTVKMGPGGEPAEHTYGSFVYDAMTDEEGRIFIAGQERTRDYIDPRITRGYEQEIVTEDGNQENVSSGGITTEDDLDTADGLEADSDLSPMDSDTQLDMYRLEDHVVITEGDWEISLRLFWDGKIRFWSEVSGLKKDGQACLGLWRFDLPTPLLQFNCFEAYAIEEHTLEIQDEDGNAFDDDAGMNPSEAWPVYNFGTDKADTIKFRPGNNQEEWRHLFGVGKACSSVKFYPENGTEYEPGVALAENSSGCDHFEGSD